MTLTTTNIPAAQRRAPITDNDTLVSHAMPSVELFPELAEPSPLFIPTPPAELPAFDEDAERSIADLSPAALATLSGFSEATVSRVLVLFPERRVLLAVDPWNGAVRETVLAATSDPYLDLRCAVAIGTELALATLSADEFARWTRGRVGASERAFRESSIPAVFDPTRLGRAVSERQFPRALLRVAEAGAPCITAPRSLSHGTDSIDHDPAIAALRHVFAHGRSGSSVDPAGDLIRPGVAFADVDSRVWSVRTFPLWPFTDGPRTLADVDAPSLPVSPLVGATVTHADVEELHEHGACWSGIVDALEAFGATFEQQTPTCCECGQEIEHGDPGDEPVVECVPFTLDAEDVRYLYREGWSNAAREILDLDESETPERWSYSLAELHELPTFRVSSWMLDVPRTLRLLVEEEELDEDADADTVNAVRELLAQCSTNGVIPPCSAVFSERYARSAIRWSLLGGRSSSWAHRQLRLHVGDSTLSAIELASFAGGVILRALGGSRVTLRVMANERLPVIASEVTTDHPTSIWARTIAATPLGAYRIPNA